MIQLMKVPIFYLDENIIFKPKTASSSAFKDRFHRRTMRPTPHLSRDFFLYVFDIHGSN